jgi:hypothetical protein
MVQMRAIVKHPAKRDIKMFTAFFSKFKAEPETNQSYELATQALNERVANMFWKPGIEPKAFPMEPNPTMLVKKTISIRRAIAA